MKLTEILRQGQIIPDLQARSKRAVMLELCQAMRQERFYLDSDRLVEVLLERERLGSTGIGDGIAIPHGKLPHLTELQLAFGRSQVGVDFDSLDGKPVHLFFLVVVPEYSTDVHLKALARISRLLKSHAVRKYLMQAKDVQEMFQFIKAQDEEF
ncbi:nitrogen PTS system EIIA component [Desulfarculales bacterium]